MDKPTELKGFYKTEQGHLINKDAGALAEYKAQKARNARLNKVEEEVTSIKNDLTEIKELLKGLVK